MAQQAQQPLQSKRILLLPSHDHHDVHSTPLRNQRLAGQYRMDRMTTCFVILAVLLGLCQENATAFMPPFATTQQQRTHRSSRVVTDRTTTTTTATQLRISHDLQGSWSTAGSSSRLGVRNRVKAVLAKARSRSKESVTQTASTTFYPQNRSSGFVIPQTPPSPPLPVRSLSPQPYFLGAVSYIPRTTSNDAAAAADRFLFPTIFTPGTGRIVTAADDPDNPLLDLGETKSASLASSGSAEEVVPLPFTLPTLSPMQKQLLAAGERIQEQSKMGREGSGYVVLDVDAPDYVVWECLLDFEKYPSFIGTVREMRLSDTVERPTEYDVPAPVQCGGATRYGTGLETRASFVLSKFRLNIAAVHTYQPHPAGHFMQFGLDKSCRNAVLKDAKGIWHTESNPDGREGITRVWLLCELQVSSVLPSFIVDYTAKKAMPRASNWIRPTVEAKKREMNLS
jgi:hypothetical protein